jgi:hypothetical protein
VSARQTRGRAWVVVRALLGLIGIAVVVGLVREVGTDALAETIVPALPWLPVALLLEVARIAMDAVSSHLTLGRRARVPWLPMFGAHLVAYAIMGVSPAGQIGASEGGFALAAETLAASVPQAMSVALLSHVVQLALVAVGFVVLTTWRPAREAARAG